MKIKYPIKHPHSHSVEEIVKALNTPVETGLDEAEIRLRAQKFGANIYEGQKQKSVLMMLVLQFKSPIVYLLFFAVAVTLFFQNFVEAIAIMVVILLNAIIGFFMELQARSSMNALKEMDVLQARVVRDGNVQEIPAEKIVPGDIILLEAGDVIPGDARIIESNQLQCDESALTGESLPTEKNTEKLPNTTAVGDRFNMVFKGTSVMKGNGKVIVTGISRNTELGTITSLVESAEEQKTPLDKEISILSKRLIWITLLMTLVFAITGIIQGKPGVLILETSIALAVAAFPEGLPIVSTVALAFGMLLMAKRNAIVKKLSAVETLGSTNVILTDKTGTLTENKIYVDTFSFPGEIAKVSIENNVLKFKDGKLKESEEAYRTITRIGALCNNTAVKNSEEQTKLLGDPIEIALVQLAEAAGSSTTELRKDFERIGEVPFNSDTKIMGTLHRNSSGYWVAAKGSTEDLLRSCNRILIGATAREMGEEDRKKILSAADELASNGLRVLAFAYNEQTALDQDDFLKELIYVGLIGFLDPPRLDIKEAILSCRQAGIKIVMITGDHPLTALNIAKKVGLIDEDDKDVIVGKDLPSMEEQLTEKWKSSILSTAVFARTSPKQKLEIVETYQNAGNIVAMTGDGVNDAPALKKADIGIAMGVRGTQVAKETASMVLKDDSFTSIAHAVSHGREIFQNIKKFVVYLVSCNLSEILIVTTLGFIAPASTLLPLQILFLNMVTDVFPALALGLGKGDKTVMQRPPRDPASHIVSKKDWISIVLYAMLMTLGVIAAVLYCKHTVSMDDRVVNNVAFFTLAFAQLLHVFNMSSNRLNILVNDITKNKFVWLALVICIVLLMLVYLLPQMRLVLGLEILSTESWRVSIVASFIPLILVQTWKLIFQRRKRTPYSN